MKINYVIASYPGITKSRVDSPYSSECLDKHLKNLRNIIEKKKELNIECFLSRITVMILKSKSNDTYENYYRINEWLDMFKNTGIELIFLNYIGHNIHYSYDQWIQGIMNSITKCDYHIVIEDDYVIHPDCIDFDKKLTDIYLNKFQNNIGYLAQRTSCIHGHRYHACISNGIISSETIKLLGDDPLNIYYSYSNLTYYAQINFSVMFIDRNIPVDNYGEYYRQPFWSNGHIVDLSLYTNIKDACFVPIQELE